jgi:hypothetical protein
MKRILEFQEFMDRESRTRTKGLNEKEFLEVFRENCKNFSFDNDMLWRNTNNFGDFGLFFEEARRGTIGTYNYKDFFDDRKEYIVPRYKSLIGSTTKEGAETFASDTNTYIVIPFDGANSKYLLQKLNYKIYYIITVIYTTKNLFMFCNLRWF